MNEMTEKRTPELIGAEIRMYVDAGRRISLLCGIEIGKRLAEAKELLSHGEWLPWLERETEFSDRSAARYMKLYEEYGASQQGLFGPETNSPTLSNLPISKALALLSVPESDRAEFAEEVGAEQISVRELEEKIRERERELSEARKAKEEAEGLLKTQDGMLSEAKTQIAELTKQNRELESRPVEVAVETVRDEEAIAAAAKEAREKAEAEAVKAANRAAREHDKTRKELHAKLAEAKAAQEKAERELEQAKTEEGNSAKEAEEKLSEAQKEADFLRAELEEAKKRLKASDADVAKFGVWFSQVQSDFLKMTEALQKVNERSPETGEKLTKGAVTLLKSLLERMEG